MWEWHVLLSKWRHPSSPTRLEPSPPWSTTQSPTAGPSPDWPVVTQNDIEGVSLVLPDRSFFATFRPLGTAMKPWLCGANAHGESSVLYTTGMDLHLLKEGGVPYAKVPLAFYVTYVPTESRVEYMSKILHNCQKDLLQIIGKGRQFTRMVTLQRTAVFTWLMGSVIHTCWYTVSTELVHIFSTPMITNMKIHTQGHA